MPPEEPAGPDARADDGGLDPGSASDDAGPPRADGEGFRDPHLVAGRPKSTYLHVVVLALAAAADLGAFYQVIARVMGRSDEVFVYLVLIGFTSTVLYLGHVIGLFLRSRKARYDSTSILGVVVCVAVLAGLGAMAFYVRLTTPTSSTAPVGGFSSTPGAGAPPVVTDDPRLAAASVFLGLFVATVTVAAVGAYLTHNPFREQYAVAARAYRRQAAVVASADAAYIQEMGQRTSARAHTENARFIEQAQRHRNLALAEELKRVAQVRMLAAQKDPALTDSWSPDDPRPYEYLKYGPPNG